MRSVRLADIPRDPQAAPRSSLAELGELLGEWRNCDETSAGLHSFFLSEQRGKLRVRAVGTERSGVKDWGEVDASGIFFGSVDGGSVDGFVAEMQVESMRCRLQVNLKLGVAVVGGFYSHQHDTRRLFHREFFYLVPP